MRWRRFLKDYEYVVVGYAAVAGILTVNALVASTHLMVPIQAAYFAIEAPDDLLETYERIRARPNPGLKVLGVSSRCSTSGPIFLGIRTGRFARVWRGAVQDQDQQECAAEESPAYKETILTFAPKSPAPSNTRISWGGYPTC